MKSLGTHKNRAVFKYDPINFFLLYICTCYYKIIVDNPWKCPQNHWKIEKKSEWICTKGQHRITYWNKIVRRLNTRFKEIGMKSGRNWDEIGTKFGWNLDEIWTKSGRNLDEIGTKSGRNRDEIGMKLGQNRDKIGMKSGRNWHKSQAKTIK